MVMESISFADTDSMWIKVSINKIKKQRRTVFTTTTKTAKEKRQIPKGSLREKEWRKSTKKGNVSKKGNKITFYITSRCLLSSPRQSRKSKSTKRMQ